MEDEHRLTARSDDMHVRRPVIIWPDYHPQAIEPKNYRHGLLYQKPKR